MSDLISRSKLIEEVNEWIEVTGVIPIGTSYHSELIGCIEHQPTAYDVDKVVEHVEKKAMKMSTAKPPHTYMRAIGTKEAVKIIRGGRMDVSTKD